MPLAGYRVLVAEDQALVALDIAATLRGAGFTILGPATNVERAMQLAQSETFSCAVLDVMMGAGYIYPVADIVQQMGKGIVFVTGVPHTPELKARWPEASILSKPPSVPALIQVVLNACKSSN